MTPNQTERPKRLLRTADLIAMLQHQDPAGTGIISFNINEGDCTGEVYADAIQMFQKNARQTDEGDQDILKIHLWLEG